MDNYPPVFQKFANFLPSIQNEQMGRYRMSQTINEFFKDIKWEFEKEYKNRQTIKNDMELLLSKINEKQEKFISDLSNNRLVIHCCVNSNNPCNQNYNEVFKSPLYSAPSTLINQNQQQSNKVNVENDGFLTKLLFGDSNKQQQQLQQQQKQLQLQQQHQKQKQDEREAELQKAEKEIKLKQKQQEKIELQLKLQQQKQEEEALKLKKEMEEEEEKKVQLKLQQQKQAEEEALLKEQEKLLLQQQLQLKSTRKFNDLKLYYSSKNEMYFGPLKTFLSTIQQSKDYNYNNNDDSSFNFILEIDKNSSSSSPLSLSSSSFDISIGIGSNNSKYNKQSISLFVIYCTGARVNYETFKDELESLCKRTKVIVVFIIMGSLSKPIVKIDEFKGDVVSFQFFNDEILNSDQNKDSFKSLCDIINKIKD